MEDFKLTFPSSNGDAELLVNIGNRISINVYEGKTASFDKKDFIKIINIINHILQED